MSEKLLNVTFFILCAWSLMLPRHASAQLYVMSAVDVLADHSGVEASCETKLTLAGVPAPYYYEVGLYCSEHDPTGPTYQVPELCDNQSNTQYNVAECSWTVPFQPGYFYKVNTDHILVLWSATGSQSCMGYGPGAVPCGPPYADTGWFSTLHDPGVSGHLIGQQTWPSPLATSFGPLELSESEQFMARSEATFQAINVTPPQASSFQTQTIDFVSNYDQLQEEAGAAEDDLVNWCVSNSAAGCSGGITVGTFLNQPDSTNATYKAPDPIPNPNPPPPNPLITNQFPPTVPSYVCGQEALDDSNLTCAAITLTELTLLINPSPVSLSLGQGATFTAEINSGAANVTWQPWTTSPSVQGTTGQATISDGIAEQTYTFGPSAFQVGTYTLSASAAVDLSSDGSNGSSNYPLTAATTITVGSNLKSQTITFGAIASQTVNTPLALSAKASSRLSVGYLSTTPAVCTASGSTASFSAIGNCTLQAYQTGNSSYSAAPTVSQTFAVIGEAQTISFPTIPAQVAVQSVPLSATASSGLQVSFSSATPSVCLVAGMTASTLAAGTCTIQANQVGNTVYRTATPVTQSFTVTAGVPQTISFPALSSPQSVGIYLPLTATATSGLAVGFVSLSPTVCNVEGSTALLLASGTCSIQANQAGNATYQGAPPVSQSFTVAQMAQTINIGDIPLQYTGTTFGLPAFASSGLPISYTSTTPTICTVAGVTGSIVLLAPGECTVQGSQAGNAAYLSAPVVTVSFTVAINTQLSSNGNLGTINIRAISAPTTLTFTMGSAVTLGSKAVVMLGAGGLDFADAGTGSCTIGTTYNPGDTCTMDVTFAPLFPGPRSGAAVLYDSSGNEIATGYLQGVGVGPLANFSPSTQYIVNSPKSGGIDSSVGPAVDGKGNVYFIGAMSNPFIPQPFYVYKAAPQPNGAYSISVVNTSALNSPDDLAIDGSGSIYVAESANGSPSPRILKETPTAGGAYIESTVPTSASFPWTLRADGRGNVYIADTGAGQVLKETPVAGGYVESVVANSASTTQFQPISLAADQSGNVYILDYLSKQVLKETLQSDGSYAPSIVGGGFNTPWGIAVDGNGNVYVADAGTNQIYKEVATAGSYTQTTVPITGLSYPDYLTIDGSGNIYIVEAPNGLLLKEDFADAPSLSFATTAPGSTSADSPQTVTVENVGNAVLNFPVPPAGNNPSISSNFSVTSSGTSACPLVTSGSSAGGILEAGQSCLLPISFVPSMTGTLNGTLALTDDSLNAPSPGYTTQGISLSGTGGQASQSINFTPPPSSVIYGVSPITLSATASSGLPVTFGATGPATVSGNTLTIKGVGTVVVTASQAGNASFSAATPVSYTITVTKH